MDNYDIVDIYNENKGKTGKTKIRHKDILENGEYIIGVQAVIINSNNQILISKRSKEKRAYPLMWECNGGALLAGETCVEGILREVKEELGIEFESDDAIFLKSIKKESKFKDIYLFNKDIDISSIRFCDNEAMAAKWVSIDQFMNMFNNGKIVPNVDFGIEEYNECLEIINKKTDK